MKKIIATLALIIACQGIFAQNIKSIINEFKEVKGVEYTKVPRWTLLLSNNKGVKSICYLDLGSCPSEVKEDFRQKVNQLEGYEVLFRGKENGEMYKLLAKKNNEVIRELIILIAKTLVVLVIIMSHLKLKAQIDLNLMFHQVNLVI